MFNRLLLVLTHIYEGIRTVSAQLSDVLAAATALQTSNADLQASIDLNTAATKAAVAAGIGVAPVDLQPAVDALTAAKAASDTAKSDVDASTNELTTATPST